MTQTRQYDHDDMVSVVAHLTRIVQRRAGQPQPACVASIPELCGLICIGLDLDHALIATQAMAQVASMGNPQ